MSRSLLFLRRESDLFVVRVIFVTEELFNTRIQVLLLFDVLGRCFIICRQIAISVHILVTFVMFVVLYFHSSQSWRNWPLARGCWDVFHGFWAILDAFGLGDLLLAGILMS